MLADHIRGFRNKSWFFERKKLRKSLKKIPKDGYKRDY